MESSLNSSQSLNSLNSNNSQNQFVYVSQSVVENILRNTSQALENFGKKFVVDPGMRGEDFINDFRQMRLIPKELVPILTKQELQKYEILNKEQKKKLVLFINRQKKVLDGMKKPIFVRCYYGNNILKSIALVVAPRGHEYHKQKIQSQIEHIQMQKEAFELLQTIRPSTAYRRTLFIPNQQQQQEIAQNEEQQMRQLEREVELQESQQNLNEINQNNDEQQEQQLVQPVNGKRGDIHMYQLQQSIDQLGEEIVFQQMRNRSSTVRFRPNTLKRQTCYICKTYNQNILFCSNCDSSQHLYCIEKFNRMRRFQPYKCSICQYDLLLSAVPQRQERAYNEEYISDDDEIDNQEIENVFDSSDPDVNERQQ